MSEIRNPILPGFHPDPSILRVGEDYYIATSTFEWFPGVQIHHSRDLVNWELISYPLSRVSQLNMLGEDNSCGVWAPCLSYDKGTYYLIYTDVRSFLECLGHPQLSGNCKGYPRTLVRADLSQFQWF